MIFNNAFSLTLCICVGIYLSKKGIIDGHVSSKMREVVVSVSLPCVLILAMQRPFDPESFAKSKTVFLWAVIVNLTLISVGVLVSILIEKNKKRRGAIITSIGYSNIAYMGFPIVSSLLGDHILLYGAIFSMLHNISLFTVGSVAASYKSDVPFEIKFRNFFTNPIKATIIGYFLFLNSIILPEFIVQPMSLMAQTATPMFLLGTGYVLTETSFSLKDFNLQFIFILVLKLLILPIILFYIFRSFIDDTDILILLSVFAALPGGLSSGAMVHKYKGDYIFASKVIFATTILTAFTLPIFVNFIQNNL